MSVRIGINGFGRIGRMVFQAICDQGLLGKKIDVVAVVDVSTDADYFAYQLKYDSIHGKFKHQLSTAKSDPAKPEADILIVNGHKIKCVAATKSPAELPWKTLDIDIVIESTGLFTDGEKAGGHLLAGAKKVIISAPGEKDIDATIVFGVNHTLLKPEHTVISNASCTTNCLAPVAKIAHENIGIKTGLMTTVHAYTNDQALLDMFHKDLRRARSATQSMIPTKTGAAVAIGLVLPDLAGKLDGFAIRVPMVNVSVVDFTFEALRDTTVHEINQLMRAASQTSLKNILAYVDEPLVSIDFNHHPASSIFDASGTKVLGRLVKVLSWYDNEWGFSNRMLDTTLAWMHAK